MAAITKKASKGKRKTAKPRSAEKKSLKFLTYNTHLFDDTAMSVKDITKKKYVLEDKDRRKVFEKIIASEAYDVIGFNEVWSNDWKAHIKKIGHKHGYHVHYKRTWKNSTKNNYKYLGTWNVPDNGLVLLVKNTFELKGVKSKLALYDAKFCSPSSFINACDAKITLCLSKCMTDMTEFKNCTEHISQKGILHVRFKDKNNKYWNFFLTHTHANNSTARDKDLIKLLSKALERKSDERIVIMGDLNFDVDNSKEPRPYLFKVMVDAYRHINPKPLCSDECTDHDCGCTISKDNLLNKHFWDDKKKKLKNLRYDYFLVNDKVNLERATSQLARKWTYKSKKYGKNMDISDHYGLELSIADPS